MVKHSKGNSAANEVSNIFTLVPDIYQLMSKKSDWFKPHSMSFSEDVASRLKRHFDEYTDRPTLRLSQMGPKCERALWYSVHAPELAEPLPPQAMIKYSYGHVLEALAILLCKASGHEVTGEQDELRVDGIVGHRDCVVDGCVLDVKSCSSYAFQKFKERTIRDDDSFGYLEQLDGYVCGSQQDPLVRVKDKGYILAIDKVLGHMVLYEHAYREDHIRKRIRDYKTIVALDRPPACTCETVPAGKSGNIKLGVRASYSPYKFECFPKLRTFIYANGPVYLTEVRQKPDVLEIDRHGKPVM